MPGTQLVVLASRLSEIDGFEVRSVQGSVFSASPLPRCIFAEWRCSIRFQWLSRSDDIDIIKQHNAGVWNLDEFGCIWNTLLN